MLYLVSQPEISYLKKDYDVLKVWAAPEGEWFKFAVHELEEDTPIEEIEAELVVVDQLTYLTPKEIDYYKKRYGN